jgi:hypothetical protein
MAIFNSEVPASDYTSCKDDPKVVSRVRSYYHFTSRCPFLLVGIYISLTFTSHCHQIFRQLLSLSNPYVSSIVSKIVAPVAAAFPADLSRIPRIYDWLIEGYVGWYRGAS